MLCINELDRGGAEKAMRMIAQGLAVRGWRVSVVSVRDEGVVAGELRSAGIDVFSLGCGQVHDVRAIWRLRRLLRHQRPHVLACFLHQANIVGRIAGRLAGIPVVTSGIRVADRRKWVVWSDRWTRALVSHFISVSRAVGRFHASACKIRSDRWTAILNGVDVKKYASVRQSSNDASDQIRLLFVGRLTEQKRPFDLIHALQRLSEQGLDGLRADFVGTGPLEFQLKVEVEQLGLSNVHFHGEVDDVRHWMGISHLLVLPSAWEGLPNVILEAMAARLPVIASEVDGTPELIEHGVTGWLVPPGNVDELARRIRHVAESEDERRKVSANAFERVSSQFSWNSVADQYDALLKKLLADARQ